MCRLMYVSPGAIKTTSKLKKLFHIIGLHAAANDQDDGVGVMHNKLIVRQLKPPHTLPANWADNVFDTSKKPDHLVGHWRSASAGTARTANEVQPMIFYKEGNAALIGAHNGYFSGTSYTHVTNSSPQSDTYRALTTLYNDYLDNGVKPLEVAVFTAWLNSFKSDTTAALILQYGEHMYIYRHGRPLHVTQSETGFIIHTDDVALKNAMYLVEDTHVVTSELPADTLYCFHTRERVFANATSHPISLSQVVVETKSTVYVGGFGKTNTYYPETTTSAKSTEELVQKLLTHFNPLRGSCVALLYAMLTELNVNVSSATFSADVWKHLRPETVDLMLKIKITDQHRKLAHTFNRIVTPSKTLDVLRKLHTPSDSIPSSLFWLCGYTVDSLASDLSTIVSELDLAI